jgi:hypothetical protein
VYVTWFLSEHVAIRMVDDDLSYQSGCLDPPGKCKDIDGKQFLSGIASSKGVRFTRNQQSVSSNLTFMRPLFQVELGDVVVVLTQLLH